MRLSRFRFTIRRFMIAVAILAILMASGITAARLSHLREGFRERARFHEMQGQDLKDWLRASIDDPELKEALKLELPPVNPIVEALELAALSEEERRESRESDREIQRQAQLFKELTQTYAKIGEFARKECEYHDALAKKYREAAGRPWKAVPPDAKDPGYDLVYLTNLMMSATMTTEKKMQPPRPDAGEIEAAAEEPPAPGNATP